ncbi:guanylate-binding protein 1-like [Pristis pectinata]|uniref:guanylate-binding protein 1-like n=1 Tax=Pristis pectinata TaxID=685728 RepID=UPI00223DC0D8|nr:guanylate-binding protein 1-like [Pristis pectinata]XP_051865902.1 guanylate-binding protein 1-like [Pristis pectinata]XP_051865903.1 guanylate-binding protein 1-like [Pristis pectinata]XP_051865904.1 guanylate-binding protein 1-like [Pristis pectinata]
MEEPMALVYNTDGKLQVNPDALSVLQSVEDPLIVVAVAGAYRTGKSYLLNRIAKIKMGFSLGSTVETHTKGIWMWCRPLPQRPGQSLLLLDTEGLGDPEKGDSDNDTSIFSLAILLSSIFIYNCRGNIDQQSMADLHFVTELSKRIQVRSQHNVSDSRDFVRFFPEFVWVIRDLNLELEIEGKEVSADDYLEHCLRLREDESSEQNREYNDLRRCIRDHFPTRRCFAFPCPAQRKKLKGLQEMEDEDLDEEFVEELRRLCEYVLTNKKVKRVLGGHQVTGRRFAELTETYVGMMADGALPCVKTSVARLMEVENKAALDEALAFYKQKMSQISHRGPEAYNKLLKDSHENYKEALKIFMKKSMNDSSEKHLKELVETMTSHCDSLMNKIKVESQERCEAFLSEVMRSIEGKLASQQYLAAGGYQELDSELSEAVNKYRDGTKDEVQGYSVLDRFLEEKKPLLDQVQKVDRKRTEETLALEKELSRVKEEMERRERERKAAEERRTKELLAQLRKKFEEGKKFSLEELKEAMDHTEREVKKYLSEGRKEDAKSAQETYNYLKQKYEEENDQSFITKLKFAAHCLLAGAVTGLSVMKVGGVPGMIGGVVVGGVLAGIGSLTDSSKK